MTSIYTDTGDSELMIQGTKETTNQQKIFNLRWVPYLKKPYSNQSNLPDDYSPELGKSDVQTTIT